MACPPRSPAASPATRSPCSSRNPTSGASPDPAAGAGGLEAVTNELATAAWALFQDIQGRGGMLAVLRDGWWQSQIAEKHNARLKQLATGKLALTGTSAFPQLDEATVETLDVTADPKRGLPKLRAGQPDMAFADLIAALQSGSTRADVAPGPQATIKIDALPSARDAEPFETLRDRADAHAESTGKRPAVFLANLGPLAEHTVRATWTKNLLAVGGIDVISTEGFTNSGDTGAAFAQSGASIACICSSDANYESLGEATAQALKSAGATHVCLAGRPGDTEQALRTAGVDTFLFAGMDMLDGLTALQEHLGCSA